MPDWIVQHWAKWLFGLLGAGLSAGVAAVIARLKARSHKVEMAAVNQRLGRIDVALSASMYDRLYHLHCTFTRKGWVSIPDLENITGVYEGYKGLGGNGMGKILYNEISELPRFPPAQ